MTLRELIADKRVDIDNPIKVLDTRDGDIYEPEINSCYSTIYLEINTTLPEDLDKHE